MVRLTEPNKTLSAFRSWMSCKLYWACSLVNLVYVFSNEVNDHRHHANVLEFRHVSVCACGMGWEYGIIMLGDRLGFSTLDLGFGNTWSSLTVILHGLELRLVPHDPSKAWLWSSILGWSCPNSHTHVRTKGGIFIVGSVTVTLLKYKDDDLYSSCYKVSLPLHLWSRNTGSKFQMHQLSLRNNRLKFKTAGKSLIILEEFIENTPINKGKPEDVNMQPVELVNAIISTDYAQKFPLSPLFTQPLVRICLNCNKNLRVFYS